MFLRTLEKELEETKATKVVFISGHECQSSNYEYALYEVEVAELINAEQGKKVILIDGLFAFQNTLNYVRPRLELWQLNKELMSCN